MQIAPTSVMSASLAPIERNANRFLRAGILPLRYCGAPRRRIRRQGITLARMGKL